MKLSKAFQEGVGKLAGGLIITAGLTWLLAFTLYGLREIKEIVLGG